MEDFSIYPLLKLINTHLKVIVSTQKLLLEEQQRQTQIAREARDAFQKKAAVPTTTPTGPRKNKPPLFITPTEIATVMSCNPDYAYVRARAIRAEFGLKPRGPIPIEIFCKATHLTMEALLIRLGYDPE